MENQIQIAFGPLCDSIATQLKKQGFKYDKVKVKAFQSNLNCIIELDFAFILNDKMKEKCQQKLFNRIKAHVKLKNKLK